MPLATTIAIQYCLKTALHVYIHISFTFSCFFINFMKYSHRRAFLFSKCTYNIPINIHSTCCEFPNRNIMFHRDQFALQLSFNIIMPAVIVIAHPVQSLRDFSMRCYFHVTAAINPERAHSEPTKVSCAQQVRSAFRTGSATH